MDVGDLAGLQVESGRMVHPAVDGDNRQGSGHAGDRDRDSCQEVRAGRQAVPAVHVDPDEDRLQEEREPLDREPEAEHAPERRHEARPEQPELEAEDRSGDHTDREQRDEDPRPAPRERQVDGVAAAEPEPFGEKHHDGKGDREADERDVHDERERLHLARLERVVLIRGDQDTGVEEGRSDGLILPESREPRTP